MKLGKGVIDDDSLVFVREHGVLIHPERLSKWFDQGVKRAELPRLTFRGPRHSYVTMLLRAGQPLHVVAHRAGYSSPNVTSAVNSHVLPGDEAQVRWRTDRPSRSRSIDQIAKSTIEVRLQIDEV